MNTNLIGSIEQGRAKFAYECANQTRTLQKFAFQEKEVPFPPIFEAIVEFIQSQMKKHFHKELKDQAKSEELTQLLQTFQKDSKAYYQGYLERKESKKDNATTKFEDYLIELYQKYGKEYKSNVKGIPAMIKTNGLGATFAFVKSKGKDDKTKPYHLIYQQLTGWLKYEPKHLLPGTLWQKDGKERELVDVLIGLNSPTYRAVTVEVLTLFNWLKRFADGLIEGEDEA